jgi:hypothetical protein
MKLQIVQLRGRNKGRYGWVLYTPDVMVQCLKTFASKEEAEADAAEFQKGDEALH